MKIAGDMLLSFKNVCKFVGDDKTSSVCFFIEAFEVDDNIGDIALELCPHFFFFLVGAS